MQSLNVIKKESFKYYTLYVLILTQLVNGHSHSDKNVVEYEVSHLMQQRRLNSIE